MSLCSLLSLLPCLTTFTSPQLLTTISSDWLSPLYNGLGTTPPIPIDCKSFTIAFELSWESRAKITERVRNSSHSLALTWNSFQWLASSFSTLTKDPCSHNKQSWFSFFSLILDYPGAAHRQNWNQSTSHKERFQEKNKPPVPAAPSYPESLKWNEWNGGYNPKAETRQWHGQAFKISYLPSHLLRPHSMFMIDRYPRTLASKQIGLLLRIFNWSSSTWPHIHISKMVCLLLIEDGIMLEVSKFHRKRWIFLTVIQFQ